VDTIYKAETLPTTYDAWKTKAINIDGLERRRQEQKCSTVHCAPNFPNKDIKKDHEPPRVNQGSGGGVIYGGQGQKMDLDEA
jgi:hypothetical protein